jgi:hypothetical protein
MPLSTIGNTCTHREAFRTYPDWYDQCKLLSVFGCQQYGTNCEWVNGDICGKKSGSTEIRPCNTYYDSSKCELDTSCEWVTSTIVTTATSTISKSVSIPTPILSGGCGGGNGG